jgi:hypothetical protein
MTRLAAQRFGSLLSRALLLGALVFDPLLFVLLTCADGTAESTVAAANATAAATATVTPPRSCAHLSIGSDEPAVVVPIERALRATPAFTRGEFTLSDTPGKADVLIVVRSGRTLPLAVLTYNIRADGAHSAGLFQNTSLVEATHPQELANEIVSTVQRSCSGSAPEDAGEAVRASARRALALPSALTEAERAERIRTLRTVRVVVHTSQMNATDVRAALTRDAGLHARNVSAVIGAADATLEITHEDASSLRWQFALVDCRNNALLGGGSVFAFHGGHAAPAIALHIARLLAPGAPGNTRALAVRTALERLGHQPEWKAKLASESYGGASGGDPLELAVEDDRLVAYGRETGRRIFSIRLGVIEDLDFKREWHSPLTEAVLSPLDADTAEQLAGGDPYGMGLGAVVGWVGLGAALLPFRTPQNFLAIAWTEGGGEPHIETVTLDIPRGEIKSLKAALAPLIAARN